MVSGFLTNILFTMNVLTGLHVEQGKYLHLERSVATLCILNFQSTNSCWTDPERRKAVFPCVMQFHCKECQISDPVASARVCQSLRENKKITSQGMDCFCLLFVIGLRWFNNARKGAVNLGAMHFTSLHALIKALTSVGHTKEGSYLHTHVKKNTHKRTCTLAHTPLTA